MLTRAVSMEAATFKQRLIKAVCRFDDFTADNDSYGEHDFGKVRLDDADHYFQIDYYDKDPLMPYEHSSEDVSNPAITCRVMTIMKAEDY